MLKPPVNNVTFFKNFVTFFNLKTVIFITPKLKRIMISPILKYPETGYCGRNFLKKYILFFSFGLFCLGIMANAPLASKQQIGMFKNSKTCVVFEDGITLYNAYIKDAVQKYWKSTNYEFIDQKEFEKRRRDSKYSFIVLTDEAYGKDPGGIKYRYINLVLGDTSGNLASMPEYCSIPLSYSGDNGADYEYVIPSMVKFIQIHMKTLERDRFSILLSGLKFYNKTGIKDKDLLLNKDKMASAVNTPAKIKSAYPYHTQLLSASEIKEDLIADPANTVFHFHVGPPLNAGEGKCFEMIFDQEGNLYYYNFRKITNDNGEGFNQDDFKRIRKRN
jgi:hypothetical protein